MMGKDHKSALLVLTGRTTLITMIEKLNGKTANEVTSKIKERLSRFSSSYLKTLTFDNGKEFANHQEIAKAFNVKTHFTTPYTSQEKGTVENRIGVIRRFFPKKTDLRQVSKERIKQVELSINNRPIRKFNYLSPIETLNNKFVALMS
jgi:IS30 family transposase